MTETAVDADFPFSELDDICEGVRYSMEIMSEKDDERIIALQPTAREILRVFKNLVNGCKIIKEENPRGFKNWKEYRS